MKNLNVGGIGSGFVLVQIDDFKIAIREEEVLVTALDEHGRLWIMHLTDKEGEELCWFPLPEIPDV